MRKLSDQTLTVRRSPQAPPNIHMISQRFHSSGYFVPAWYLLFRILQLSSGATRFSERYVRQPGRTRLTRRSAPFRYRDRSKNPINPKKGQKASRQLKNHMPLAAPIYRMHFFFPHTCSTFPRPATPRSRKGDFPPIGWIARNNKIGLNFLDGITRQLPRSPATGCCWRRKARERNSRRLKYNCTLTLTSLVLRFFLIPQVLMSGGPNGHLISPTTGTIR